MSKISTYEVAPVPKLSDKLIGTSVGGEIEDITYNFTLLELLELFLPVIPANNLQGVLDYGNTATQDINLFGTITTTNLEVTDTANLFITYLNEETHIVGSLFDSADSIGTAGQVLTSTGDGVEWFTLPPIFTPNLQQVLEEGNTADLDIILDADLEAINITADTANIATQLSIQGTVVDYNESAGTSGQVLESTSTGVQWVNLPVYSATSPLLFDSGTNTFSIQVANSTQGGYLTANDWVTFDGKQNAGAYITALTGEATATGPGSVPITLNNASVIAKVLTGLNVTGGSISASDSILTAFGKVQNQINGLIGGVQYQGTWNAATNTPTLTSSVGTQGHFYIVSVAGNTDLNGITDWKIGDWAIFSGGAWSKVDNTESVTSVNGQIGAVSLTTDDIPEGATNLYYLDSRARGALSFAAGSGAYNSLTGVITIPTNNNQILNGAGYITLNSISATAPLTYNNLTGAFSIPKATALVDGYLSATDWSTFNNKQNYLGGTGLVKSTAGTITYITDNSGNWNTAYDRSIVSAAVTGTTTKTLTLTEQDGNTIQASWTDLDTGLTSVGVSMPAAFSVANSPLTSNGTIAITGAGTTLQYIDGTGALQTFPGLTGFVPYTGATQNVNLGEYGISAGYFQADLTPTGTLQVGRMQWNATDGTMDLRLLGNNVTLQIGQENVTRVVNKSGIDLLEANYQVVRVRKVAEGGAQGQRLAVVLAQGNNENNSTEVLGLVTETINANQEGFVTAFGEVKNINTTGSLQGETWVDGDVLYVSTSVAGQLTNIRPIAPNHAVTVGYVTYAHANNGKIYMAIDTGYELGELHNVYAPSPTANQSIYWNTTNSRYELNTIGGILGYTPANAATLISTTAPLQGGGDLSTNRTFSITQAGASTDGYLSSTDWNTFNNKQPAGSYVPTSRQLTINGTQYDLSADRSWSVGTVTSVAALTLGTSGTDLSSSVANGTTNPVITLNVPTASAANRGALSAADWSTFNTKVGSVTASSPLASSGGQTPNITIQQASGSQNGYLSSTDWTTFNNKQAAGNYITSLTGEATASGPGAAAVTLNNASVTGKVLTGVNITGGSISATDSILTAFGKVQNQINGLVGGSIYQGTWNAATNTPALASGVGTKGYYYIVSVAGTTNLDGITDWFVGDWAIFDGTAWQQVDNTDAVVSVNGQTGAVSLTTDNIPEGSTNQYFLNSRARAALSFTAGSGAYNSTTGVITIPTNTSQLTNGANFITLASLSGTAPIVYSNTTGAISITQSGTASNGYLSSTDWNTFNNKAPSVSGGYLPLSGGTMTGQLSSTFISSGGALLLNSGDDSGASGNRVQIALGYDGSSTYKHYITTTHNNGTSGLNGIRFYTSDGVMNGIFPTNAVLGLTVENGNIASGSGTFSGNIQVGGAAITGNSSVFYNTAAETTLAVKQTSGANKITLALWNDATTSDNQFLRFFTEASPTFRGAIHYDRAGSRLNIIGEGSGLLFTGLSTFSSNISTGGVAPYPNVAVSIRGTISGNDDSWGVYQNVTFAPSANNALSVGYHAGGASKVNTGALTGLSYRGFYQEDLVASIGTGTLATTYGIYISALTRGVNNYSAYFAQNVGIGTATPSYPLDVNGFGRFYAAQADVKINATSTTEYSRLIFEENGVGKGGIEYINSAFATTARRNKLELFNQGSIHFITSGSFVTPDFSIDASGNINAVGSITGSIAALGTAATLFVVSSGGTLRSRTAAEVRSDIGAQPSGNYVTTDTTQSISGLKTFTANTAGGSGDYTNMTSYSFRVSPTADYWRIPFLSVSSTISGVFNFETGKNVFWGEPTDTGTYNFRGRNTIFGAYVGINGAAATYPLTVYNGANGTTAGIGGTAYGLRIDNGGTFSTGMTTLYGVDNTFYGSYQPIKIAGSIVYLGSGTGTALTIATTQAATFSNTITTNSPGGGVNAATFNDRTGAVGAEVDQYGGLNAYSGILNNNGNFSTGSSGTAYVFKAGAVQQFSVSATNMAVVGTVTAGGYFYANSTSPNSSGFIPQLSGTGKGWFATAGTTGDLLNEAATGDLIIRTQLGKILLGTYISGAADAYTALCIANNRNVGIGTTSPFAMLHVNGTPDTNYGNQTLFDNRSAATNYGGVISFSGYKTTTAAANVWAQIAGRNEAGNGTENGYLAFITNTGTTYAERMRITSGGNVGIGTIAPTAPLTVAGTTDLAWSASTSKLQISRSGSVARLQNYENGSASNLLLNWEGGNIGIRSTSPQAYLDIGGVADQTNFSSLIIRAGNSDDSAPESNQILFGYSNSANYAHAIKTRHQSGSQAGNSIEFWVWKYGDAISTPAGQRVMLVEGNGVRIADSSGTVNSMSASERLNVNGTVYATGYYETSDIRLKNVLSTTNGDIPAITYTWKDGRDNKLHWGYAAQDVMKYLPDAVSGSEYYGLDYNQVHTYKIAIIEDEVDLLKKEVSELKVKLQKYEA